MAKQSPKKPAKCTTSAIEDELKKLREGGFKCAVAYLEDELRRRKKSTGKRAKHDDPRHKQMREASARYRKAKLEKMLKQVEAENLPQQADSDPVIEYDEGY